MCNLYLMYYSKVDDGGFKLCDHQENRNITKMLSSNSTESLPDDSNRDQSIEHFTFSVEKRKNIIRPDRLM